MTVECDAPWAARTLWLPAGLRITDQKGLGRHAFLLSIRGRQLLLRGTETSSDALVSVISFGRAGPFNIHKWSLLVIPQPVHGKRLKINSVFKISSCSCSSHLMGSHVFDTMSESDAFESISLLGYFC